MKSPLYMSPFIYESLVPLKHRELFADRVALLYRLLNGKKVVELGCGTGHNSDFLDCDYHGFDMNQAFIDYGKRKKRRVDVGNAFDVPLEDYELILIVDVLHHLPDHPDLLKKALDTGKELVVCEPFDHEFSNGVVEFIYTHLNRWIDSDGINPPIKWYKKDDLKSFFKVGGNCDLYEIGEDVIAHYKNR